MKLTTSVAATMALGASAAGTLNYTDSYTGISFSGYSDGNGYLFGMALPETIGTDAIIQLVAPATDGAGWAGFDFGVEMANKLLLCAWPNSDAVVTSARVATGYTNPSEYSGDITLYPIADGTYVNSTHYSATFLCSGCVTNDDDTFLTTATTATLGWAYSDEAPTTPSDTASVLNYHSSGFGGFGMSLAYAMSAEYDTWAALASTTASWPSTSTGGNSTNGASNSTTPSNSTTTVTYSNTTYDYIIAGAGPAGLVVAGRLAETGASVLLIERGGASTMSTGGDATLSWNSSITQYDVPAEAYYLSSASVTDEYCTDTASQAGCLLGGSGMVNALMFVKPQDKDFDDNWPTGWKSADVADAAERFYARSPGTTLPSADGQRYDQGAYDVLSSFLSSNNFSSVDAIEQPNEKVDVFSHPPWLIQDGMRGGPVKSYLPLVEDLSNFKLSLNTKVIRAVRNGTWVSGVEVELEDGTHQIISVTASTGKVILAAGTMSTPRILFYSGIGPTEQIEAVPSDVTLPDSSEWIDLPVGQGVKDHTIITFTLGSKTSLSSLASANFTSPDDDSVSLFAKGSGLLTQGGQRLNFWTSVVSPSDGLTRYMQGTCNSPSDDTIKIKLYVTHGLTSSTDLVLDSTGAMTEFSGSPWLQTQGDIEAFQAMFDRFIEMTGKSNSSLTLQYADGTAVSSNVTGATYYENVKSTYTTGAHFVGTAKMGTDDGRTDNGTAVVDTNTQVYGTDNLFVVDGSFHPDLPTGNTQAIILVAAEQAVEKILALDNKTISDSNSGTTTGSSGSGSTTGSGSSSGSSSGSGKGSKCKRAAKALREREAKEKATAQARRQVRGVAHKAYVQGLTNRRSSLGDMYM
ncbi:linoleate diol synthase [Seiridium cupressi]